ncbi:MAG: DUF4325 domain-containing protein [Rhizobiales bacterium]|nr:DUF4325 domain-containing protein [Hyphomicrobiales bacterium]
MHNITAKLGYGDVVLDFSSCTKAMAGEMIAIAARCQEYWKKSIDVQLELPADEKLKKLFRNSNWAYFIDPRSHAESRYRGVEQVPMLRFSDAKEQQIAVDRILDVLLAALSDFSRADLTAIEWALNEVADNVNNHAQSTMGGFLQVTNFRNSKAVEFAVCDVGIGIPSSLRPTTKDNKRDHEWLDRAIREGVTRDSKVGQGNGLYGTWRITQKSQGQFHIMSGRGSLVSSQSSGLHVSETQVPFSGTLVIARIGYRAPIALSDALTFRGRQHEPTGYLDVKYEPDTQGNINFNLSIESSGFGSRAAGEPIRRKLSNLARLSSAGRVVVDLAGIPLVSSSYADEVFGKLFVELGPISFAKNFELRNVDPLVRDLIDRAIYQRMSGGPQSA